MVNNRSRQEIIWIPPNENIPKFLRRLSPLTFLIRVQAFRDLLLSEIPHVQIFKNDGPNPLTWDAQLLSYWFSRNAAVFRDSLMNLINNYRGVHCFASSRTRSNTGKKSPRLNWATLFLTVAYGGEYSPNGSIRIAWISFGAFPFRKKTW